MTESRITRTIGKSPTINLPTVATYGWLVKRCEELNRMEPQDEDFRDEKLDFLEGVIVSLPDNLADDHPIRFYDNNGYDEELEEYESLFVESDYGKQTEWEFGKQTEWEFGHDSWTGDCIWVTPTPERYAKWRSTGA